MGWTDEDEAHRVQKFLNNGLYEPEDLTHNEIRLLREYRPQTYDFVKWWLENRNQMIEQGEWTTEHEPPQHDRRIQRYEDGKGAVKRFGEGREGGR